LAPHTCASAPSRAEPRGQRKLSEGVAAPALAGPYDGLPDTIELKGTVRDFHENSEEAGHADFERKPGAGFGHYFNIVEDQLDEDGKPVFRSFGYKKTADWQDASGRPIMPPREYLTSLEGDSRWRTPSTSIRPRSS